MRKHFPIVCLWAILGFTITAQAQSGCPGCTTHLPENLPADTVYLGAAPNGRAGEYYEGDISFRMPKTSTPVAANDSTVAPGITINQIIITSVSNIPPGLNWEASQLEFNVAEETDGCVRFCGTPLQPGLYEVEVVVTAKVFIITQTTSFSFPIYIAPAVSVTEGFTIENSSGCGEVLASFQNNIPSRGKAGFSYKWDFGNGQTSIDENPSDQIYRQSGTYFVDYQVIVDTAGYFLTSVRIDEVSCSDLLGNRPDLWLEVLDTAGNILYKSGVTMDARLPLTYNLNIPVKEGNYTIKVTDEDDGFLGNADDPCGTATFNRLSSGNLQGVDFKTAITIIHPVDTIRSRDTVRVYAQPETPVLTGYAGEKLCKSDTIELHTSYPNQLQWFKNDEPIIAATTNILLATETGDYQVQYTSTQGCRAISSPLSLTFAPPPAIPIFLNNQNKLTLYDATQLPASYRAQWYLNGTAIPNATGTAFCATASGSYVLEITDNTTGCSTTYSRIVTYDPNFAGCGTTDVEDNLLERVSDVKLFPNPTSGNSWLQFNMNETTDATMIVRNALGVEISRAMYRNLLGKSQLEINLINEPAGFYFIELQVQEGRKNWKVVKQ